MGLTKKFRSKKTDQETQSPVIKVFKEIMHRSDNANNPEKVNLIKSKHEKKTKRYSRSKAKTEEKSDDTSATCTDRNYNVLQSQQPLQSFSKIRSTVLPAAAAAAPVPTTEDTTKIPTDSKTSSKAKCMWGGSATKMTNSKDDTCSCMTCALKKLSKSQRNRLLCIGAILLITLIVAMYFIMRPNPRKLKKLSKSQRNRLLGIGAILLITLIVAMYFIMRPSPPKRSRDLTKTYEILARTLQPEGDKRDRRSQYELEKTADERPDWEDSKSKLLSGLSDLYGPDFSDGSLYEETLHEAMPLEAPSSSSLTDLSNVLDPNKISEGYSSNSLRNFYKKLIKTDMQIKNLKKSIRDTQSFNDYTDFNMARAKRSLRTTAKVNKDGGRVARDDFKEFNLFFPPATAFKVAQPTVNKVKRQFNYSNPTGILIEKQKLVLEYEPKTKVAKCSHTPKDLKTKAHESDHKNPYYTHSERLDDILERLLANPKVSPESIFDKIAKIKNAQTSIYRNSAPPAPPTHPFPPAPNAPPKCCEPQSTDLALLVKKIKHPHGNDYILSTENIFELKHQKQPSCMTMSGLSSTYGLKTTPTLTVMSRLRFFKEYEPRHRVEDANTGSEVDQMQEHLQKVKQQFNGVLSVSTLITGNKMPEEKKTEIQRVPGHRRLLQVALEELVDEEDQRTPEHRLMRVDHEDMSEEKSIVPKDHRLMQVDQQDMPEVKSMVPKDQRLMQVDQQDMPEEKNIVPKDHRQVDHEDMSEEKSMVPKDQRLKQVDHEDMPEEKNIVPKDYRQVDHEDMSEEKSMVPKDQRLMQVDQQDMSEEKSIVPKDQRLMQVDHEDMSEENSMVPKDQRLKQMDHHDMPEEKSMVPKIPGRRLLQVDLEEDRWEVDPRGEERTRRMAQLQPPKQTKANFFPIDTHNPNWKDTMPLYPDELNAIIKQAAIQNYNKVIPVNSDSTVTKDMSDTEYVEDYTNNKYDKLVKMAQAYSDYGVLDDKKEMRNDNKNGKGLDNRVKLSASTCLGFFGRFKKSKTDKHYEIPEEVPVLIEKEGIRFEFKPNPRSDSKESSAAKHVTEHDPPDHVANEVFQFGKHVKIASNYPKNPLMLATGQSHTPIIKSFDFMTPALKSASSSKPLKQTRVSGRGLFFFGPHRRSLKSVEDEELGEVTDTYEFDITSIPNTTQEAVNDEELQTDGTDYSSVTASFYTGSPVEIETKDNNTMNNENGPDFNKSVVAEDEKFTSNLSSPIVAFEEFYEEITNWIMSLAGSGVNGNVTNDTSKLSDLEKNLKPDTILFIPLPPFPILGSKDVGIGKRKLMSIEENLNVPAPATTAQLNKLENASNIEGNTIPTDVANIDNKTIVKRSAPDTNLIFWNDIYDEEYGVKDPLDDTVRDKHTAKLNNEFISKPGNWIGVKLRNIADRVRKTAKSQRKSVTIPVMIKKKIDKRSDKLFEDPPDKMNFATLTANMKKVCRQAAKAVHETKNSEVRTRSEAASTLMQQLVGLMSDLVEIQVQQKTCVQLPPDLQKFLAWLTGPSADEQDIPPSQNQNQETTSETYPPGGLPTEIFREIPTSSPDLMPSSTDIRTECLGTIHDVQRLITQYDGMSEEDKSKMSGVREYLENQLDFLHKQLSSFEGYYDPTMFHRIRRRQTPKHKKLRRMKRKIHRFIKNFGKKRTRSTVTYDFFETYTDSYNKKTERKELNAIKDDKIKGTNEEKDNDDVKRNIPDVYYRALAEYKNSSFTTVKSSSTKSA